jgi:hypothetical protein
MRGNATRWILGTAATTMVTIASLASHAAPPEKTATINLAVASNFYGYRRRIAR